MNRNRTAALTAAALALAIPATASAHVTLNPNTAPSKGEVEELVRVPNEEDSGNTVKVDLQLPPGFVQASYEPMPGWAVKVKKAKLAKPIQTDDGPVTEQVSEIIWTGDGKQGKIAPGQFADFPLSVGIPGKAGEKLTFKAIQTYDNGKVVRWIGGPDSDTPAPQVTVTPEQKEGAVAPAAASSAPAAAVTKSDDSGSKTLSVIALIVGALGLAAGGIALLRARRVRSGVA